MKVSTWKITKTGKSFHYEGPSFGCCRARHGVLYSTRRHWVCATWARQCHHQWKNKWTCTTFWLRSMESFHTAKRHSKWCLGLWPHLHSRCRRRFVALSRCSVALCQAAATSPASICLQWEAEPQLEWTTALSIWNCLPTLLSSHSCCWEISNTFHERLTSFYWQFTLARDCSVATGHSWTHI